VSLNSEIVNLLIFPIEFLLQSDDTGDLVDRKAPVVSERILPEPIPNCSVRSDVDVYGLDPSHLRVDSRVLVDSDGLVPRRADENRSVVIEILKK
jgi:hypothetical protein